jgi:hypothetical protein|tara:strand:- start:1106 stop:1309 length:204 start_codon:yes stop_codon:yes gene_type:complete
MKKRNTVGDAVITNIYKDKYEPEDTVIEFKGSSITADEVQYALEQRANELFGEEVGGGSYNIGYGDG